ncbi:MAG: hypothetical protein RI894_2222 [Bacteroidota bacterium]|jgi:AcrR family transcriptional regulator
MPKIDSETKVRIMAAAEKVFHANGFKGARTTTIAEEAGISRTMLHYHYSTKEALFGEVLKNTLDDVLKQITRTFSVENKGLTAFLEHLIDVIADLLEMKPGFPTFMVNIIHESPEMTMLFATSGDDSVPLLLNNLLEQARKNGEITDTVSGENLLMSIYMLCAAPYIGAPYIKFKENRSDEDMKSFAQKRRAHIKKLVVNGLK